MFPTDIRKFVQKVIFATKTYRKKEQKLTKKVLDLTKETH